MRKISLIAIAAALILMGVGMEAGAWTTATTRTLTANPVIDPSAPMSATNLSASLYDDGFLVFPAVIGQ
jgi:hypothetical protein